MTDEIEVMLEDGRTITLRQKPVEPQKSDPVHDARTIEELQALIDDEAEHPDLAMRASQRITELVAAQMTRADQTQFLTRVRVGNETVVLDQHDCALLRQKLAEGQVSVASCQDHKRDRCDCWLSTRNFVWSLQRTRPDSAITKASEQLWTAVEDFARAYTKPKEVDPSISALIQAFEDREPDCLANAQNEEFKIKKQMPRGENHMTTDSTTKERITEIIRNLERLRARLDEVHAAGTLHPMSQDIGRLEAALSKQWNQLVSELSEAGVEHDYKTRTVIEEEPKDLTWIQTLFVESGLDIRDLTRSDEPPRSMFCDGWDF